jgi:D-alanine-D-alanine ligase-like ATP-grasp enzyme
VGEEFFAVEIHADSDAGRLDWRSDYASLRYLKTRVPQAVKERVTEFMKYFGIVFGAFDFVITPNGDWRFLEVNPNGQWSWLEHHVDVEISEAIADLLARGAEKGVER